GEKDPDTLLELLVLAVPLAGDEMPGPLNVGCPRLRFGFLGEVQPGGGQPQASQARPDDPEHPHAFRIHRSPPVNLQTKRSEERTGWNTRSRVQQSRSPLRRNRSGTDQPSRSAAPHLDL